MTAHLDTIPMCPRCKRYFTVGPTPHVCPACDRETVRVPREGLSFAKRETAQRGAP